MVKQAEVIGMDNKVPLKRLLKVIQLFYEEKERALYTKQVHAKAYTQLMERTPIPKLLLAGMLRTLQVYRSTREFIVTLLDRLVVRSRIWDFPQLFKGFMMCIKVQRYTCLNSN